MIDNTITYQTPEGTELSIVPVSIITRAMAWIIDAIIRFIIMVVVGLIMAWFESAGFGMIMLASFVVMWLYPVLFEVLRNGQTIGKKVFGIYVCMDNGMPVGWQASMIRNLLMLADFMPFAFGVGIASTLFTKSNKRLGDIMAGTVVAYLPTKTKAIPTVSNFTPVYPPISLDFNEQKAMIAFVERYEALPVNRRDELADILSAMTDNGGYETIAGYANSILGESITSDTSTNSSRK